jgi:hypothetical protein
MELAGYGAQKAVQLEHSAGQFVLWNFHKRINAAWPEPHSEHRNSARRPDHQVLPHLADKHRHRLPHNRAVRIELLEGIAEVKNDFRAAIGKNSLGRLSLARVAGETPDTLNKPGERISWLEFHVAHCLQMICGRDAPVKLHGELELLKKCR